MSEPLRRPGYGLDNVGERGERTRERIRAVALSRFAAGGFHRTSIQEIADGAGVSRAALYQYFGSKEQIFLELLGDSGSAVVDLARRFEPPAPTADGFRAFRSWIEDWAYIFDRHSTMFTEWGGITAPDNSIEQAVGSFVTRLNRRLAETLRLAGVRGIDPLSAAIVLSNVILRFNFLRVRGGPRYADPELYYHLAVLLQLMLFPETPADATRPRLHEPQEWFERRVDGPLPSRRGVPAAAPYYARFESLSARSAGTVRELMKSGLRVFTEKGYHRASVDEIVADADYTRGTFYKYFDDKVDLLVALSDECSQDLAADARRFGRLDPAQEDGAQLRRWVRESFVLYGQHRGAYRTWVERSPTNPELDGMRDRVVVAMRRALHVTLGRVERSHPLDLRVSHMFLVALIEEIPLAFKLNGLPVKQEPLTELLSVIIERTLFNAV
ncbi:TetR/AcrR family transcriptional regulator [Nocardia jiangxiensis]|uniref:TetR/AcrR family transcriptional regulator n=1 Tax=Nocardia jiangxiensis TaxID=282685 RepID=A0ABW6SC09_9NOCA